MLPVFAVIAGKTLFDVVIGFFIACGTVSVVKIAQDKGEKIGYYRGLEYRTQELAHLRHLVQEFQMTREALKDRIFTMVSPFKRIDICDPRFFSKSLAILEHHLPNWRDQMRKEA